MRGNERGFLRLQGAERGRNILLRMDLKLPWGLFPTVQSYQLLSPELVPDTKPGASHELSLTILNNPVRQVLLSSFYKLKNDNNRKTCKG